MAPLDDPLETDPARRYKAIYEIGPPGFRVADELPGANVRRAYSADSIHWTTYDEPPMFEGLGAKQGDSIYPFFDPETRTYNILTRHPWMEMAPRPRVGLVEKAIAGGSTTDPAHGLSNRRGMRRIFQSQSRDFHHWSEPRLALAPDPELDNLDDSFYSMRPYRLGSHWVAFLGVLAMTEYKLHPQLAFSRDARNWDRLRPTHTWIPGGGPGSYDELVVAAPHMVDVGDESWFYYGGAGAVSAKQRQPYGLGLGKLRRHGFVSVGTNDKHVGMLLTEAFIAPGDRLVINASCGPEGLYQGGGVGRDLPGDGRSVRGRLRRVHGRLDFPRRDLGRRRDPAPAGGDRLGNGVFDLHPAPPPAVLHARRAALLVSNHQLGRLSLVRQ